MVLTTQWSNSVPGGLVIGEAALRLDEPSQLHAQAVDGIGSVDHAAGIRPEHTIQAAIAILDKHLKQPGGIFNSPSAVLQYLRLALQPEDREVFFAMFLDTRNCLIDALTMFVSSLAQTAVYPREVARKAMRLNTVAVIVAHNHPSGNPEPSVADEQMTKMLRAAQELIEVRMLDHIIVAGNRTTSFAERGLLEPQRYGEPGHWRASWKHPRNTAQTERRFAGNAC